MDGQKSTQNWIIMDPKSILLNWIQLNPSIWLGNPNCQLLLLVEFQFRLDKITSKCSENFGAWERKAPNTAPGMSLMIRTMGPSTFEIFRINELSVKPSWLVENFKTQSWPSVRGGSSLKQECFFFFFIHISDYSGDLNSEHLNKGNTWITNFHLFAIQMPANSSLFKPWPEYQTKSSLFKPWPE